MNQPPIPRVLSASFSDPLVTRRNVMCQRALPFARAVCVPSVRPSKSKTYFSYVAKMRFLGSEKTGSRGEFRHSRKDHVA